MILFRGIALRPALFLLLLTGALLLAEPARARPEGDGGSGGVDSADGAGGAAPSEAPGEDGGNDVPEGDSGAGAGGGEDDEGGGADADARSEGTPRTEAPPRKETSTIPLESGAQQTGETSSNEETIEPSTEPATPSIEPTPPAGRLPQYRLTTRGGETCILMEMDAVVGVFYETKSKEIRDLEEYVDDVEPKGFCDDDQAQLTIAWKAFELRWSFSKTPGGERWYVNLVELKYDKSDSLFENASSVGDVTLSTRRAHGTMLFPTPVGKSYHCQSEYKLNLNNGHGGSDSATLLLRQFRMQPFMYKQSFGPVFECTPGGGAKFRDETAPIAVGSTLAVVVLLTVTGYGVYRYFKIKKVQYDTME